VVAPSTPMVLEITEIDVKPERCDAFEAAVATCEDILQRAKGWRGLELHRSKEVPGRYYLLVAWDSIENHTVDFWQSADFQTWRARVGECFVRKPVVQHTDLCAAMGARPSGSDTTAPSWVGATASDPEGLTPPRTPTSP
jgi:quinol monooxygenase YgiN